MRADLEIILELISSNTSVLDLGCGEGELLKILSLQKQTYGIGLEIDQQKIIKCLENNINAIEYNLNTGLLKEFAEKSFDTVIMTQSLQALINPDLILKRMLHIGKNCIVTFPNFGHWRCRVDLTLKGKMPKSEFMPYEWYNTPNIHFCTFKDFESLCKQLDIKIINKFAVNRNHYDTFLNKAAPNLFAEIGIYKISST